MKSKKPVNPFFTKKRVVLQTDFTEKKKYHIKASSKAVEEKERKKTRES